MGRAHEHAQQKMACTKFEGLNLNFSIHEFGIWEVATLQANNSLGM